MSPHQNIRILNRNKKYHLEYDILYEVDCGLVLHGIEVKEIRKHVPSLYNCYGRIINREIWLYNFHIPSFIAQSSLKKLLAHKREIKKIISHCQSPRVVIIPIEIYEIRGRIKVKIICAEALQKFDKRQRIREKEERRMSDDL